MFFQPDLCAQLAADILAHCDNCPRKVIMASRGAGAFPYHISRPEPRCHIEGYYHDLSRCYV
jgi:hypothetical protein